MKMMNMPNNREDILKFKNEAVVNMMRIQAEPLNLDYAMRQINILTQLTECLSNAYLDILNKSDANE